MKEVICGIYKITNQINNKVYIGQSINIYKRWKSHKERANYPKSVNYNQPISRAIRKYGIDNFSFEILEQCDYSMLDEREEYYIELYQSIGDKGYNLDRGGAKKSKQVEGYIYHPKPIKYKPIERIEKNKILRTNEAEKLKEKDISSYYSHKNKITEIYFELLKDTPVNSIQNNLNASVTMIDDVNNGAYDSMLCEFSPKYPIITNNCPVCGAKLYSLFTLRCKTCKMESELKVNHIPTKEELKKLIKNKTFFEVGKIYGVSDNSIRKWCKKFGLPTQQSEIMFYTDKEWEEATFDNIPYVPFKREQRINELIEEYENGSSIHALSKKYNISQATIREAFNKKQIGILQTTQEPLPVYKIDPVSLTILEEFPSIASIKNLGDVSACIHGRRKTSGGYKWVFKKNAIGYNIGDILPEELLPIYIR